MSNSRRDSIPRSRSELSERIEELRATVQRLQDRVEALEAKRNRLQEENRALRQEVTHARLIDGVLASLEEEDGDAEPPDSPPALGDLYRALPASCTFRTFFRVAAGEGVGTTDARRYLRRLLNREHLARDGARLRKQEPIPRE